MTKNLNEGLAYEDLKGLVDNTISIDQYKPKIGEDEDTVVVAFKVTYEDPAKDLSNFIETGDLEHLDVEASTVPETDGSYRVFVEFLRDFKLFDKLQAMLHSIDQITSREDGLWAYRAYNIKTEIEFTEENFKRDIIDSRVEYRKKYDETAPDALEESWLRRIEKYRKT